MGIAQISQKLTSDLSIDDASDLYSRIKDYTGFKKLRQYLPEEIMCTSSYLFEAVRAAELIIFIRKKYGENWWKGTGLVQS